MVRVINLHFAAFLLDNTCHPRYNNEGSGSKIIPAVLSTLIDFRPVGNKQHMPL